MTSKAGRPSEREEKFARLLVEGMSQSDAYRKIYPHSKRWKASSVHVNAAKLAAKIKPRVDAMRAKAEDKALLSLEDHIRRLDEIGRKAEHDEKWAAAVTAEVKRGEAVGLYIARSESVNTNYNISDQPLNEDDWAAQFADEPGSVH